MNSKDANTNMWSMDIIRLAIYFVYTPDDPLSSEQEQETGSRSMTKYVENIKLP